MSRLQFISRGGGGGFFLACRSLSSTKTKPEPERMVILNRHKNYFGQGKDKTKQQNKVVCCWTHFIAQGRKMTK